MSMKRLIRGLLASMALTCALLVLLVKVELETWPMMGVIFVIVCLFYWQASGEE